MIIVYQAVNIQVKTHQGECVRPFPGSRSDRAAVATLSRSQIQTVRVPLTTHQGYAVYISKCDRRYHADCNLPSAKYIPTPYNDNRILRGQHSQTKGTARQHKHTLGVRAGIDRCASIKQTRCSGVCVICSPVIPRPHTQVTENNTSRVKTRRRAALPVFTCLGNQVRHIPALHNPSADPRPLAGEGVALGGPGEEEGRDEGTKEGRNEETEGGENVRTKR